MINEFVVCDKCGKQEILKHLVGWIKVERFEFIDVRTYDDIWKERHFCGWPCAYEFTKSIVPRRWRGEE